MKHWRFFLWVTFVVVAAGCGGGDRGVGPTSVSAGPAMRFFVTSTKSVTGNLSGLRGADIMCHNLAAAVGAAPDEEQQLATGRPRRLNALRYAEGAAIPWTFARALA